MSLPGGEEPRHPWQRQPPENQWPPQAPEDPWQQQQPPPQEQQPWQQGEWVPPPPTSGSATASLILGVCGLVVCPLICSVLALVFGYKARGEIDRSNGGLGGGGAALAGIVLGWIGVVICVLFGLLIIVGLLAS